MYTVYFVLEWTLNSETYKWTEIKKKQHKKQHIRSTIARGSGLGTGAN